MPDTSDEVSVLKLTIHGLLVGYLVGFRNGHNVLSLADEFKNNPNLSRGQENNGCIPYFQTCCQKVLYESLLRKA